MCRPQIKVLPLDKVLQEPEVYKQQCAKDPTLTTPVQYGELELFPLCPYFARKFGHATTEVVHALLEDLFII